MTRDESQREKAIQFLRDKIMPLKKDPSSAAIIFTEENERFVADSIKKVY
jgi:hypothetical protein